MKSKYDLYRLESTLELYYQLRTLNDNSEMFESAIVETIKEMQARNRVKFFDAMRAAGIEQVAVMDDECVTTEARYEGSPAIWAAVNWLAGASHSMYEGYNGFAGGCGNGNQYQCGDTWAYLGREFSGKAYEVETEKEISLEPFKRNMVVSRHSIKREYPFRRK